MPIKGRYVLGLLLTMAAPLSAQNFHIDGVFSQPAGGSITLVVYDGDTTCHRYSSRVSNGRFTFDGPLAKTAAAELQSSAMTASLFFFIDGGTITMTIAPNNPEGAHITGSRSNSEYRIAKEEWQTGHWNDEQWAKSPYAAALLYRYGDEASLLSHFDKVVPHPCCAYQYHQLRQRIEKIRRLEEGRPLPDFAFYDNEGHIQHADSLLNDTCGTVFFFTATFCKSCEAIGRRLSRLPLHTVTCCIDQHQQGWDAPFMQQMSIDHIPYMILIDTHGCIDTRDIRIWELEKRYTHQQHHGNETLPNEVPAPVQKQDMGGQQDKRPRI